ncbi:MAG: hypothetical protein ACYTGC_19515 [Planctomycetota bacterium]
MSPPPQVSGTPSVVAPIVLNGVAAPTITSASAQSSLSGGVSKPTSTSSMYHSSLDWLPLVRKRIRNSEWNGDGNSPVRSCTQSVNSFWSTPSEMIVLSRFHVLPAQYSTSSVSSASTFLCCV